MDCNLNEGCDFNSEVKLILERIDKLINSLLDYEKELSLNPANIGAGKLFDYEEANLSTLVNDLIELVGLDKASEMVQPLIASSRLDLGILPES